MNSKECTVTLTFRKDGGQKVEYALTGVKVGQRWEAAGSHVVCTIWANDAEGQQKTRSILDPLEAEVEVTSVA